MIAKAHAALPKGGVLIVCEAIIDDQWRQNTFGLLMSLNMLIETQAGFDFTGANCSGWMREAGFKETRVEPLCGPDALLRTIASHLVPLRPERSEPRARKRRPKNYQLLTRPRKKMHTAPVRNRPKNKS